MDLQDGVTLPGATDIIPCGCACTPLILLQQFYHSAPVGMAAISKDHCFKRLNNRLAEFIGKTPQECLGQKVSKVLPEFGEKISDIITSVFITKKEQLEREIAFQHHGEFKFWVINIYPILCDEAESEDGFDCANLIIHDISELRKAQSKLEIAYERISNLKKRLEQENQYLKNEINKEYDFQHIIGSSVGLKLVLEQVSQVSMTDATVLITGETGTGKELIARAIHQNSARKAHTLITVNCAALPANLIESELFGHEKGAFTGAVNRKAGRFEIADGGTIFLDEIGELPLELQSKLLRVLQEGQIERLGGTKTIDVNVRVIAATNRDLAQESINGRFREDLYYRLNVFPIHIPRLAERKDDIIEMATSFMQNFAHRMRKNITSISDESMDKLTSYDWPGNVRELKNLIERAVIICPSEVLEVSIPTNPFRHETNRSSEIPLLQGTSFPTLNEFEKSYIQKVLEKTGGRVRGKGGAAEILGMKPTTLDSRMLKLGIKRIPTIAPS